MGGPSGEVFPTTAFVQGELPEVTSFTTDAREYDSAEVIERALDIYACAQGADRIGIRCLRPLFDGDDPPVLGQRGQQLRAVLAGVYDLRRLRDVARLLADLDARAADDNRDRLGLADSHGRWHCYYHAQRVTAPITNRLLQGREGTVKSAGISAYTTLNRRH